MLAATSQLVNKQAQETFSQIPAIIQQTIEMLQQMQPPPQMPADPRVEVMKQQIEAQMQKDQADAQFKQQKAQTDAQLKQAEMQLRSQERQMTLQQQIEKLQAELQREQLRQSAEDQRTRAEIDARLAMNESDNQTAKQLAALEIASGDKVGVSTGTGINPNPRP
jgi:hypothetical protein